MENRRNFIRKIAAGLSAVGFAAIFKVSKAESSKTKKVFVHHVFFWLKNPDNKSDREKFEKGIEDLLKVPVIKSNHVGIPVESPRDVVDDSFTYSYMVTFDSTEDQNIYQKHPIHLKFVEDCKDLWEKVIVYDAIN